MFSIDPTQVAVHIALTIAVNQLAHFGAGTNWDQVKVQTDSHLKWIHPTWLEAAGENAVGAIFDACAIVCQDKDDVKGLIQTATAGDVPGAVKELKAILLKVLPPHGSLTAQLQPLLAA